MALPFIVIGAGMAGKSTVCPCCMFAFPSGQITEAYPFMHMITVNDPGSVCSVVLPLARIWRTRKCVQFAISVSGIAFGAG